MMKTLTIDNFLLPDPLTGGFVTQDAGGRDRYRSAVDWAQEIHAIPLTEAAPEEVRLRFELARGILTYGFFWYPFWSHGVVEALRAAETAVEIACAELGAPKRVKDASTRIAWLAEREVLESRDVEWWAGVEPLAGTDALSDPHWHGPERALETLAQVSALLGRLFIPDG